MIPEAKPRDDLKVKQIEADNDSSIQHEVQTAEDKTLKATVSDESIFGETGIAVVKQLKRELEADSELLGVPVVSLDTLVCQNKCGGHGVCDQATRECVCQPAWMENIFSRRMMGGQPNCDWSVVYVCVIAGVLSLLCFVCCCLASCKKGSAKTVCWCKGLYR